MHARHRYRTINPINPRPPIPTTGSAHATGGRDGEEEVFPQVPRAISPVILIPGITASVLHDEYELPPEAVWTTALRRRYERITLHPLTLRSADHPPYELRGPARVAPRGPFPLIYEDLVEELRDGLSEDHGGPVPVFPFGYDWRMPLDHTEQLLAAFVDEVIERTLLLPHYRSDPDYPDHPTVSLIGHSMGGLVIAGYIQRHTAGRVDRVVTLASPFRGSYEAVLKLATGTGDFGDDSGKARERRMARLTPALYHLLPSFGGLNADNGLATDLFQPDTWQPNVARTIEQQVSAWGVSGPDLLRAILDQARAHRDRISSLRLHGPRDPHRSDPPRHRFTTDHWLAIAGADCETRVGLRIESDENGEPRFVLRSSERRNHWDSRDAGPTTRRQTGDGTVPLDAAIPPFLDDSRLVCVTPGDFGYWELRDRALASLAGFHGLLPKMNMLHRLILRFLLGKADPYRSTWGRRLPGAEAWNPPLAPLREKE